jgi:uncharacterized protein YbbC (DUF1343 family)
MIISLFLPSFLNKINIFKSKKLFLKMIKIPKKLFDKIFVKLLMAVCCSVLMLACQKYKNTTSKADSSSSTKNETNTQKDSLKAITLTNPSKITPKIILGINQFEKYLPILKNKRVGLVVNHTSQIQNVHLADTLLALGVNLRVIFAPEHGFRGEADAGETVKNSKDTKTGLLIVSLYGKNKKPTPEQLQNLDVVIFDIQDVGARFYTYISTMHYVMEACGENNKKLLILDRPNPNGSFVDGCILDKKFTSFVGIHPIPILHGLTVGELAKMINGEKWLLNEIQCDLEVIGMQNYTHQTPYELPIKPSPNLPTSQAVRLYASLCLFEGTQISVARGTLFPFQAIGFPDAQMGDFTFTPVSIAGMAKNPPFQNQICYGLDLRQDTTKGFQLKFLIDFYKKFDKFQKNSLNKNTNNSQFFNDFFDKLAGSDQLRKQIQTNTSETAIRESWKKNLEDYQKLRKKYLLYPL